ncbi:MAG: hypothetical protein ABQ298_11555 [Puniceicoccaceae bacterium]
MKFPHQRLATTATLALSVCASTATPTDPSPFGIAWGMLYGYSNEPARPYVDEIRKLGADFTKVFLFWQQIEPEQDQYDWTVVDAFADQLVRPEEGLITLFSSSLWATEQPSNLLPPSPARNLEDYYDFVYQTVKRCAGKVRYWSNDIEANNPVFWSGTREQYVQQLKVFYQAVKDADPNAEVVLGGYDGLFVPPGTTTPDGHALPPMPGQEDNLEFYEYVIEHAGDCFDIFDLRLYLSPYLIVPRIEYIRQLLDSHGCTQPILVGEYGAPGFFDFPENFRYVELAMSRMNDLSQADPDGSAASISSTVQQGIAELYDTMPTLAPQTQMFLLDCPPELHAKFRRIQSRHLVMQNVMALSAGVIRTLYWQYSPLRERNNPRHDIMTLLFGKFGMMEYEGDAMKPTPTAHTFARMTRALSGIQSVTRVPLSDPASVFLFKVDRAAQGTTYVAWDYRDAFDGEDLPPLHCEFASEWTEVYAEDAFGNPIPASIEQGKLRFPVSVTPVYLSAQPFHELTPAGQ